MGSITDILSLSADNLLIFTFHEHVATSGVFLHFTLGVSLLTTTERAGQPDDDVAGAVLTIMSVQGADVCKLLVTVHDGAVDLEVELQHPLQLVDVDFLNSYEISVVIFLVETVEKAVDS